MPFCRSLPEWCENSSLAQSGKAVESLTAQPYLVTGFNNAYINVDKLPFILSSLQTSRENTWQRKHKARTIELPHSQ